MTRKVNTESLMPQSTDIQVFSKAQSRSFKPEFWHIRIRMFVLYREVLEA